MTKRGAGLLVIFLIWAPVFILAAILAAAIDVSWLPGIPVAGAMLHALIHLNSR